MSKDEALKLAIEIFTKFKSDYFHMTFGERWEKLDKAEQRTRVLIFEHMNSYKSK